MYKISIFIVSVWYIVTIIYIFFDVDLGAFLGRIINKLIFRIKWIFLKIKN